MRLRVAVEFSTAAGGMGNLAGAGGRQHGGDQVRRRHTALDALLCELVQEAGIPSGVVNVVTGTGEAAGAALAAHPGIRRMAFTGSPEVGKSIAETCGRNLVPVKLELGGKGAAVVFEDVDVDATARARCCDHAQRRADLLHRDALVSTSRRFVMRFSIAP